MTTPLLVEGTEQEAEIKPGTISKLDEILNTWLNESFEGGRHQKVRRSVQITSYLTLDIFTCFILISKWNVRGLIGLRDFHTTLHSAKQAPFA